MKPTQEQLQLAVKNGTDGRLYTARVIELIRQRYTLNDELAILRQRYDKPDEFTEYDGFVESCKAQAKAEIYWEG